MRNKKVLKTFLSQLELQSMLLPAIITIIVFAYVPMYGINIAFRNFHIITGTKGQPWVGFKFFMDFFTDPNFISVMRNTLAMNFLWIIFAFPVPIILAVLITELRFDLFRRVAQTFSYLPHFLSWVIYGGLALEILSPNGIISYIGQSVGIFSEPYNIMAKGEYFYIVFTILCIIKSTGFSSILFIAAIVGIDQEMGEAAIIDGANRFQRIIYIVLPSIVGTIMIMLIFNIASMLNTGFEHLLMLQNGLNLPWSETIDTYVYKIGMQLGRYSYATAVGVFKSIVNLVLLVMANYTSKKLTSKGLF